MSLNDSSLNFSIRVFFIEDNFWSATELIWVSKLVSNVSKLSSVMSSAVDFDFINVTIASDFDFNVILWLPSSS